MTTASSNSSEGRAKVLRAIEKFCGYFESEADAIARVDVVGGPEIETGAGNPSRYKKTLYVTAIDTLAGLRFHESAYPQLARRNRERFTRFVEEYGLWHAGDLVSLPFLRDELDELRILDRPLGRHVAAKMSKFSPEKHSAVELRAMDEPLRDLLALAATEKEEAAVREYHHFALFYRYRNSLVHESRQPGKAMEGLFSREEASYHGYVGEPGWHLTYPLALFEAILTRAIAEFRAYLTSNQIDPYTLVSDKARW